jgi:hypothetical protein
MVQTFYDYMVQFLQEKNAKDVVEIGSDIQLKMALTLAPFCQNFYSVNFKEHHNMMIGWHEMHQNMGVNNIRLLSGDALQLPALLYRADIIIIQNVLIDGNNGKDTELMWKYKRGEEPCSDEKWANLTSKFELAEEKAYGGFLQVAKPGYIVRFQPRAETENFRNMLTEKLRVDPAKINIENLLSNYSDGDIYYR